LDPASIFQSDVDEAKQRVQESIETLLLFRYQFAFVIVLKMYLINTHGLLL
jgi:hypothetical protein